MAGKDKEAIVICLDVGPAMNQAPAGTCSDLETACEVISMILQRKLFSESKDEACLVLFGTPDTANKLSDLGYHNITEARPLGQVDFDLIQYVKQEIQPSTVSADFIDAMVVAMDILHTAMNDKARKFTESRLILVSNLGGEFSEDKDGSVLQAVKTLKTEINFIGPFLEDEDDDDEDRQGPSNSHGGAPRKPRSAQQNAGESKMKDILNQVEGARFAYSEVIPLLSFFETKPVRQMPWKCNLELGSKLKIPVCGYTRVKPATQKSWKSVYDKGGTKEYTPTGVTSFHLNDEEETEIEEDQIVEGHRYGSDIIPISSEDKENMDYKPPGKVLQILGFTKMENVKRHQYISRGVHSFVADPNDNHGGVAFSAVVNAMYETNVAAIVRRGATARSQPKLGCLVPHIKAKYESLLFFELPFSEDVRTYGFTPITKVPKYQPSEEQLSAVDDLIDSMDLMGEKGDDDDDDEEDGEMLKPKDTLNPVFQRLYSCLLHRSLNPKESLPEIDTMLKLSLERPQAVTVKSCDAVERVKKNFRLEEVKKKEQTTANNIFADANQNGEPAVKKEAEDDGTDVTMADMTRGAVTEVGSVNPVEDFKLLITDADGPTFRNICKQLEKRIRQMVLESFGNQFFAKALECVKAYRDGSLKRKDAEAFNAFLKSFKDELKASQKLGFWQQITADKVTLISRSDCSTSDITQEEANKFLEEETQKAEVKKEEPEESADDLLDMMD